MGFDTGFTFGLDYTKQCRDCGRIGCIIYEPGKTAVICEHCLLQALSMAFLISEAEMLMTTGRDLDGELPEGGN